MSLAEKKAIESFVSLNPVWRMALPSDNHNPFFKEYLKEFPGYELYFYRMDLNQDGKNDFIVAVKNKKNGNFGIDYFLAEESDYSPPTWLQKGSFIAEGGLSSKNGEL